MNFERGRGTCMYLAFELKWQLIHVPLQVVLVYQTPLAHHQSQSQQSCCSQAANSPSLWLIEAVVEMSQQVSVRIPLQEAVAPGYSPVPDLDHQTRSLLTLQPKQYRHPNVIVESRLPMQDSHRHLHHELSFLLPIDRY